MDIFFLWTSSPQREQAGTDPSSLWAWDLHFAHGALWCFHDTQRGFPPGTRFIPPQLQIPHPKAPLQDWSQGLANVLTKCTQLEPLVAKQLLTLISFSTGSRRAANSELCKKIAASLTGFKQNSFTLLPAPDENEYPIELTSGLLGVCQIILTRQLKANTRAATPRSRQLSTQGEPVCRPVNPQISFERPLSAWS